MLGEKDCVKNIQQKGDEVGMKDEIKEILDKLKDKNNYISHSMILLSIKETTTLYDYITNLQEEYEELNGIFGTWNSRKLIKKFNKEYDKEDKRKNPNRNYVAIYPDAEEVYKRYYDYKSRIDKAIEILHQLNETLPADLVYSEIAHAEYILQGSDKNGND